MSRLLALITFGSFAANVFGLDGFTYKSSSDSCAATVADPCSPDNWWKLAGSSQCQSSSSFNQSPINFPAVVDAATHSYPIPHWTDEGCHSWAQSVKSTSVFEVSFAEALCTNLGVTFENAEFTLLQMHLHSPSEHTINGERMDAEIHLVHKNLLTSELLVMGVLLKASTSSHPAGSAFFAPIWQTGDNSVDGIALSEDCEECDVLNPYTQLIPQGSESTQYVYTGSLTTPPCTGGVNWFVFQNPVEISSQDLVYIRESVAAVSGNILSVAGDNFRPSQLMNDRSLSVIQGWTNPEESPVVSKPTHGLSVRIFQNTETVTQSNPTANQEFHCFERNKKGEVIFVRGSYGRRGYFEGRVRNQEARVDFYEVSLMGDTLVPSTGSAVLRYDSNWENVEGKYWNAGESTLKGSYGNWGVTGLCSGCKPQGLSANQIAARMCLWDPTHDSMLTDSMLTDSRNVIFGVEGSSNAFDTAGLGSWFHDGSVVGGYEYTYEDGALETGHYGGHAQAALLSQGAVIATTWTAVTGPFNGTMGSALYVISNAKESYTSSHRMVGFFCNSELSADSTSGATVSLATCSTELYIAQPTKNREKTLELLANYGKSKSEADLSWIDSLRSFVTNAFSAI